MDEIRRLALLKVSKVFQIMHEKAAWPICAVSKFFRARPKASDCLPSSVASVYSGSRVSVLAESSLKRDVSE